MRPLWRMWYTRLGSWLMTEEQWQGMVDDLLSYSDIVNLLSICYDSSYMSHGCFKVCVALAIAILAFKGGVGIWSRQNLLLVHMNILPNATADYLRCMNTCGGTWNACVALWLELNCADINWKGISPLQKKAFCGNPQICFSKFTNLWRHLITI